MRLPSISRTVFAVGAMIISLGVAGAGTWAYGQTADPTVPVREDPSSIDSRIGGTMRSQAPTDSYGKAFTVQPTAVPVGEDLSSIYSRIGGTMRGQAPID